MVNILLVDDHMHVMAWHMNMSWMRTRSRLHHMIVEVCEVDLHPLCEHHRSFPRLCSDMLFQSTVFYQMISERKVPEQCPKP